MAKSSDKPKKTLVRAANGDLYLIDAESKPIKLTSQQTEFVTGVVNGAETQLSDAMIPVIGSGVNIPHPFEVFE